MEGLSTNPADPSPVPTGLPFVPVNLNITQRIKKIIHNFFRLRCVNQLLSYVSGTAKKIENVRKIFDYRGGSQVDPIFPKNTVMLGGDTQEKLNQLLTDVKKIQSKTVATQYIFSNQDTISAAYDNDVDVIVNFANRRQPGGIGLCFYGGSQEESLVRQSNLIYGIDPKYNNGLKSQQEKELGKHAKHHIPYYGAIYTAGTTFLDKSGEPKEKKLDVVSCAAVDLRKNSDEAKFYKGNIEMINRVNRAKIDAMLAAALNFGKRKIVLGAFGCGAFKNDTKTIANLFKEALDTTFKNKFETVVFAIKEKQGKEEKLQVFKDVFKPKQSKVPVLGPEIEDQSGYVSSENEDLQEEVDRIAD